MSGRRPSEPTRPGRGGDGEIPILPIIGGLALGAGLLAFAYYMSQQTPPCRKREEVEEAKGVCPKILPNKRKCWNDVGETQQRQPKKQLVYECKKRTEENERKKLEQEIAEQCLQAEKAAEQRRRAEKAEQCRQAKKAAEQRRQAEKEAEQCRQAEKEAEQCRQAEKEAEQRRQAEKAEQCLQEEKFNKELEEKLAKLNPDNQDNRGLACVNNPDLKKYLPIIAGMTVGVGVLSLLSMGFRGPPSNVTALPMSSKPIPYGEGLTPTAVTLEDSEVDDCEECLKIDPRKRRWPTYEEEQEEYKRIRERDEQKRKVELLVQECLKKYEKSFECDVSECDDETCGL